MTHLNSSALSNFLEAKNEAQAEVQRHQAWICIAQASVILFRAFARARLEGVRYNGILECDESLTLQGLLPIITIVEIKPTEDKNSFLPIGIGSSSSIKVIDEEKAPHEKQLTDPSVGNASISWQNIPNENAWELFVQALPADKRNHFLICSSKSTLEDAHLAATAAYKAGFKHVFRVCKPIKNQAANLGSSLIPRDSMHREVLPPATMPNMKDVSVTFAFSRGKSEKRRQQALGLLHMC